MMQNLRSKWRIHLIILAILASAVFSCRADENLSSPQNKFTAPIDAFKNFDGEIDSNLAFRMENVQSDPGLTGVASKSEFTGNAQYSYPSVNIPISDVSYKIPFRETIQNYFANHPDYRQGFLNTFGEPFYNLSTYTYGRNGNMTKSITFPIVKDDEVTAIIQGMVSPSRDYVQFTVVRNDELTTQLVLQRFQEEYDSLYPSGPEILGRGISAKGSFPKEKYIRESNIEEVVIYKLNRIDNGQNGGFGVLVPGKDWWKDSDWYDPKLLNQSGGQTMSGGAEKHNKFPDYLDPNAPCIAASAASAKATETSKTLAFTSGKTAVTGMNNGKENGVVFGNVNGSIQSTGVQTGSNTSIGSLTSNFSDPIGDLHNHPNNNPPSAGDVYSLINIRNQHPNYNTRYVVTQDGTTYALVVTDYNAMNIFLQNYPPYQVQPDVAPNFPNQLFYEWSDIFGIYNGDKAIALSFILDKYNAGIALTKIDSNGDFKKINVTEKIINGSNTYTQTNCP